MISNINFFTKQEIFIEVIDELRRLEVNQPTLFPLNTLHGICYHLRNFIDREIQIRFINHLIEDWELFSGECSHPVSHPSLSPSYAFLKISNKWTGEYGKNRRKLCGHLADKIEEYLENNGYII